MSHNSRFPVGLSTFVLHQEPLPEALKKITAAGVTRVELWGEGSHADPRFIQTPVNLLRDICEAAGVVPDSVHAPFHGIDLASLDESVRLDSVNVVQSSVDLCVGIGCSILTIHSNTATHTDVETWKQAGVAAERSIAELARYAEGKGIRIAVENSVKTVEHRHGMWMAELVEMADRIGAPNLGFTLDTGHALVNGLSPVQEARVAGKRLYALHVSDNDGTSDAHLSPGLGITDWLEFIKTLDEIEFQGVFMLELMPGQDYLRAVEQVRQWLQIQL